MLGYKIKYNDMKGTKNGARRTFDYVHIYFFTVISEELKY